MHKLKIEDMYKIAAYACAESYRINKDLGTTEYHSSLKILKGQHLQVLAIPGTNEWADWFWNGMMVSWDGVKVGAYRAAKQIVKDFARLDMPLLIAVHSKSGPTGLRLKQKYFPDAYCIAFAPARGFRYSKAPKLDNTVIFSDPDDLVDKVGFISFTHPDCPVIYAKDDPWISPIDDHVMDHWIDVVNGLGD